MAIFIYSESIQSGSEIKLEFGLWREIFLSIWFSRTVLPTMKLLSIGFKNRNTNLSLNLLSHLFTKVNILKPTPI